MGVAQFDQIRKSLDQVAAELGKVEGVLKAITDVNTTDVKAPVNRLVQALDTATARTTTAAERMETLNGELEGVRAASRDLTKALGPEVAKPLAEHQKAVEGVRQQVSRTEEQLGGVARQLEIAVASSKPQAELTAQLIARMGELQSELKETNAQIKALVKRVEGAPVGDGKPGASWLHWFARK
jgi:chromosome segregation ATPase